MAVTAPSLPILERTEASRAVVWILLAFIIVALAGSPFDYADTENARYLLPVFRAVDPSLFAGDTVVDAITRFRSVFYESLAWVARSARISTDSIPTLFAALYVLVRSALACSLFLLVRSLRGSAAALALTAALCSMTKVVPLGGIALFAPKLTHVEVAMVLCLSAVAALLTGRRIAFWCLMSAAVFVHPLVTLHLAVVMLPLLLYSYREMVFRHFLGPVLFGSACIAYFVWMAPPSMSPVEREIFLMSKGSMVHVSLLSQPTVGWLTMPIVLTILVFGSRRLFGPGHQIRLLANTAIWGACAALFLSSLAVFTTSYRLAQIQPMRIFLWVWLLTLVLLSFITVEALKSRRNLGILLTSFCVFLILESVWEMAFAGLVALLLVADAPLVRRFGQRTIDRMLMRVAAVSLAAPLAVWLFSQRLPFESLRDPGLLAPCILLLTALAVVRSQPLIATAVALALVAVCIHRWDHHRSRENQDWANVERWSAESTPKSTRFLIPSGGDGFRLLARRTAINEPMSSLAWVAPLEYLRSQRLVDSVREACPSPACDIPALFRLARQEHAEFVVVHDVAGIPEPFVRFGTYSVLRVPLADMRRSQ